MNNNDVRLNNLRELMRNQGLNSLLVTDPANVFYLASFAGDGTLLITEEEQFLVTDRRYIEQAEAESSEFAIRDIVEMDWKQLTNQLPQVGFESVHLTYQNYLIWLDSIGEKLKPTNMLVEQLRMVKDEDEIERLRGAIRIGDEVFQDVLAEIRPGVSERHLAAFIEHRLRVRGCDREAFDTIAVSGKRSSLPHGTPSEKSLEIGDLLTLDFGGIYQGYCGDMTRTVAVTKSCSRIRNIYSWVLEAQMAGVEAVAPGRTCREVDMAVREVFERAELIQYFAHSTGHGVGLNVHEPPSVSKKNDRILEENMVITIEPGLYIPGWGGVRIEDVVLVRGNGHQVLTSTTKDLLII
ncbi:MAG: aminopeptidase P family protein [Syntrophomonadaceae bacterium]|nr:aminopeptidase P family protein [Syntrophomonadaceae bacterium]